MAVSLEVDSTMDPAVNSALDFIPGEAMRLLSIKPATSALLKAMRLKITLKS